LNEIKKKYGKAEGPEVRGLMSAPPLGASAQFDQKRNFGEPNFIREVG
jgi:hypothetical protein